MGNWYTSAWFEPKDRKGVAHLSKSKQRIHGSAKARVTTVPVRKLKRWGWCTSLWKGNSRGPKSRKIFQCCFSAKLIHKRLTQQSWVRVEVFFTSIVREIHGRLQLWGGLRMVGRCWEKWRSQRSSSFEPTRTPWPQSFKLCRSDWSEFIGRSEGWIFDVDWQFFLECVVL